MLKWVFLMRLFATMFMYKEKSKLKIENLVLKISFNKL